MPLPGVVAAFALSSLVVWKAGSVLASRAQAIARKTRMGEAFVGMSLLGLATSLPEVVAVGTAGVRGEPALAVGNLLGGIAFQATLLVLADAAFGSRPLASRVAKPGTLVQGTLLVALLGLVAFAIAVGDRPLVLGIGRWSVLILLGYLGSLWLAQRAQSSWRPGALEEEPDVQPRETRPHGVGRDAAAFALAAAFILAAGIAATRSAESIAQRTGIGASFAGATLLAVTTSLPEVSSTVAAARMGAAGLVIGNVFGTNLADVGLLFVADAFYRDGAILSRMGAFETAAAGLGVVLTAISMVAILRRGERTWLRLAPESFALLAAYAAGIWLLYGLR